jgi:hypothetical protein
MRLDRDKTPNFYMIDFVGRLRLTHYDPHGHGENTLIRWEWMSNARWKQELVPFLDRNPESHVIVDGHYNIIGDLNDHPVRNGAFKVDDIVMYRDDEHAMRPRKVVAVTEVAFDFPEKGTAAIYETEDGFQIYWNEREMSWMAWCEQPYSPGVRVRRPLEGELPEPAMPFAPA